MKIFKQLAGQTVVYGLGTIVPRFLNYLLTPFYTGIFLPESYGVITEVYAYVAFLMILLTYGMETTYFRFAANNNDDDKIFNTAFTSILITSSLFLILIFINLDFVSNKIGYENNQNFVIWFTLIVVLDAITAIPFAKLRQKNKALNFALIKIVNVVVNIGLNIFFLVICKNSDVEILANLYNDDIGVGYAFLSNLFASGVTLILLLPHFKGYRFKIHLKFYRKMLLYAMPLLIVGLAAMVNENSDKIVFKHLIPENLKPMRQLGIYGANYKIAVLMTIFIQMFKYAAEPFFFNQANNKDAKEIYSKVMDYFIIFCLLIFLLVTLFINVFKHFINENYFEGLFIVPIVLLANMFLGVYYNLSVWYKINDLTRFGAYISLIGMVLTVLIIFIFVPIYGYIAAAWAHFICYGSMMLLSYFLGQKHYKVKYNVKKAGLYFGLAICLYFVHDFLKINLAIEIILGIVFFMLFLYSVIKVEKIQLSNLKSFIKV